MFAMELHRSGFHRVMQKYGAEEETRIGVWWCHGTD